MNVRLLALAAACLVFLQPLAQAQEQKYADRPEDALTPLPPPAPKQLPADFIVAVVNSEPITNHEVSRQMRQVQQQIAQQNRPQPPRAELLHMVLDRLINESAQLQVAKETGIKIENSSVDQAEETIARQNQMDVPTLHRRLVKDGLSVAQFREQLRRQLILTRLRERDVEPRVRISDLEVEQYLQEKNAQSTDASIQQLHLAQLLIAVPDEANEEQVAKLQARAQSVLDRARAGEDFTALVREFSSARDREVGGQMGLRTVNRYPELFVQATQGLPVGGLSGLVRSGAGFHILKVLEKSSDGLPPESVTQSRARHILLRLTPQMTEAQALERLRDLRKRIDSGQSSFEALAREYSQDGSAPEGGDLGWAYPGQFVPEFEDVMNRLNPGQISAPVISRFGVHLIQLVERRETALTPEQRREMVRGVMREKKLDEAFVTWAQEIRARAYVELRDEPQ